MKQAKLKVSVISHTKNPEATIVAAIRQCYSPLSGRELLEKVTDDQKARLIKQIMSSGHTSTIEHVSFTFSIEGFSRISSQQLVRHRIASYSQKSQRYVVESDYQYIVPPSIEKDNKAKALYIAEIENIQKKYDGLIQLGIPAEDARMILPNGIETKLVMTMNCRSLFNFFKERLCNRAQWEIYCLAAAMLKETRKIAPNVFKYAGPTCVTDKICWQGKLNCGKPDKMKSIELRERNG